MASGDEANRYLRGNGKVSAMKLRSLNVFQPAGKFTGLERSFSVKTQPDTRSLLAASANRSSSEQREAAMQKSFFIRRLEFALLSVGLLVTAPVVEAQFTLDGSRDAAYDAPLAVQTVETQFGDNFNELDAGYAAVSGGNLHLLLTGQVENNFNKLNIFIDSIAGGQNVLTNDANNGGTNPENDGWAGKYADFTFDTGFEADYLIIVRNGNFGGDQFNLDFATIGGGLGAFESSTDIFSGSLTGVNASVGAAGIGVGFDNSNVAGVLGGTNAADQVAAAAVTTGLELVIPLSAIGNPGPGDTILISAHINGSNHDYLSNQSLGGYPPPQGNLGGDGNGAFTGTLSAIDLNNTDYAAGNQYFAISIPASSSIAEFMVTKDFSDDNPAPVEVFIRCRTGLPLEQNFTISEDTLVNFVVTEFEPGALDCDISEEPVPAGYVPTYAASAEDGVAAEIFDDEEGCHFREIEGGQFVCEIVNELQPVDVTVTKEWLTDAESQGVPFAATADYDCFNVRMEDGSLGSISGGLSFFGSVDTEVIENVHPDFAGTTYCTASEVMTDSAVEPDDSDCDHVPVSLEGGGSCTIYNTVFFEGIPTLNRHGLAFMALLMLGVGIVGLRRFV
jgi:hypothetical protein